MELNKNKDWVLSYIQRRLKWIKENDVQIRELQAETSHYLNEINKIRDIFVRGGGDSKEIDLHLSKFDKLNLREALQATEKQQCKVCLSDKVASDMFNDFACFRCLEQSLSGHGAG